MNTLSVLGKQILNWVIDMILAMSDDKACIQAGIWISDGVILCTT